MRDHSDSLHKLQIRRPFTMDDLGTPWDDYDDIMKLADAMEAKFNEIADFCNRRRYYSLFPELATSYACDEAVIPQHCSLALLFLITSKTTEPGS